MAVLEDKNAHVTIYTIYYSFILSSCRIVYFLIILHILSMTEFWSKLKCIIFSMHKIYSETYGTVLF